MIRVLYLTTSVSSPAFIARSEGTANKPNPAGQNFHETLIRCFGEVAEVLVVSFPPVALKIKTSYEEASQKVKYRYIRLAKNRIIRRTICPIKARILTKKAAKKFIPDLIVFDSLNLLCAKLANRLQRKLRRASMAVLTDAPRNITGMSESYGNKLIKIVSLADCSYSLTPGLAEEYDLKEKPSFVNPILVDEEKVSPVKMERPYIYYGGALFVKDGLEELLKSYLELSPNYDLVISGHGPYAEQIKKAAKDNPHIEFLGQIDKYAHRSYIKGALLAINPRPYREELDTVAVPSKMIEYLVYAKKIASRNTKAIKAAYPDDINWIEGDLKTFLQEHITSEGKAVELKENKASKVIIEAYGISQTAQLLRGFLVKKDIFQ